MLYWHFSYIDFLDQIEFNTGTEELESIANYWQVGVALAKKRGPVQIWFMKFDRLGLAYDFSLSGELRGIKILFNSAYDL